MVLQLLTLFSILQLIASALDVFVHGDAYNPKKSSATLIHRIAALHIVYERNKSEVLWFGQVVAHTPEVMVNLTPENVCDKEKMVIPICSQVCLSFKVFS